MTRWQKTLGIGILLWGGGLALAAPGGRIGWGKDLALEREEADVRNKPLMLYFFGSH